ncbi:SAM-dependent methyltransferase [Frankia sp. Cppng1_Ct_nod]|uniref:SAM-dependent methyltransferase n=1 Tax=Frankia sp. Cppng1_Ct_nod TaxID=2897162 RepID=UPI001F5F205A|nr:SAM-dependent methyltransferase [Frankia sp. Cppng1_Ct_nod]
MAERGRSWDFKSVAPDPDAVGTPAVELNPDVPHIARIYDYWLGGKDNYAADRAVAEQAIAAMPSMTASVRTNRAFLSRAVNYLAAEAGIRQFLDIGTGLPSADNTHEVAQRAAPSSRIVYVDKDPIVLVHARALLTTTAEGRTAYLSGDVREPAAILAKAADTLDFRRPVALMLVAIMHCVPDTDDPYGVVATLSAALPAGSFLVLSHPAHDVNPSTGAGAAAARMNQMMPEKVTMRSRAEVTRFFDGWELLEPGVVPATQWRTDDPAPTALWAGVGRKPADG